MLNRERQRSALLLPGENASELEVFGVARASFGMDGSKVSCLIRVKAGGRLRPPRPDYFAGGFSAASIAIRPMVFDRLGVGAMITSRNRVSAPRHPFRFATGSVMPMRRASRLRRLAFRPDAPRTRNHRL